jgi:hypothetical protein
MSSTIGDLVDRTFREYLEPADDLNSYTTLTNTDSISDSKTGLTSSGTSVTFNGDLLSIEEEDLLDAGTLIEINQELLLCTDLNTVTNTITVVRGARNTTAAEHETGSLIKIAPPFTRKAVYDAVKDQIETLYPTLFATEVKQVNAGNGYVVLDSVNNDNYLIAPLKAISQYTTFASGSDETTSQYRGVSVEIIDLPNPFTYTNSSGVEVTVTHTVGPDTVKALQFYGIDTGKEVFVTFKKKFKDITDETTTLSSIGLETEYEPIIMAGVAAQVLSNRDIPTATASYITQQMAVSSFPAGSANSLRNSLLQYRALLIEQARKDLRARYPEPVTINSIVYPAT